MGFYRRRSDKGAFQDERISAPNDWHLKPLRAADRSKEVVCFCSRTVPLTLYDRRGGVQCGGIHPHQGSRETLRQDRRQNDFARCRGRRWPRNFNSLPILNVEGAAQIDEDRPLGAGLRLDPTRGSLESSVDAPLGGRLREAPLG